MNRERVALSTMPVTVLDERLAFSTREACDAAGLTYRMVDYWVRAGAVWPSVPARGYGSARGWTIADVDRLARIGGVVHRAEAAGLSVGVAAIAAMWDQLTAGDPWTVTLTA
jgi:DNA-binding transcriptional MerR regulator